MSFSKEFKEMICDDIKSISEAYKLSHQAQLKLHRQLDGRYQACVKDWYKCLWGSDKDATQVYYGVLENRPEYIIENLEFMKAKLETYSFEMNAIDASVVPSTQVNVTTNVNVNVTFEQVRAKIEDMTSLTDKETEEILAKITELENIIDSKDKKKTKWEKAKSILTWLTDKSFDVGIALLPLLLKIQE